jgi:hypothetical protein
MNRALVRGPIAGLVTCVLVAGCSASTTSLQAACPTRAAVSSHVGIPAERSSALGPATQPMQPVVASLSIGDMIDAAAYAASLRP